MCISCVPQRLDINVWQIEVRSTLKGYFTQKWKVTNFHANEGFVESLELSKNVFSDTSKYLQWVCTDPSVLKPKHGKANNFISAFSLVVAVAPCGSVDVRVHAEIFCLVFFCVLMLFACCKFYLNALQHLILSGFDVLHHCKHKTHHSKPQKICCSSDPWLHYSD